jgi:lactate dehydrogenase-like 2-hydroxyacid dehydrogenase
VAWAAVNARQRLVDEIAKNIRAFIDGNPRNLVN